MLADVSSISNIAARFIPLQGLTPSGYLRTAINLIFGLAGVLAFLGLLIGGLQWILSGGEKEALDRAKRRILHSLLGLGIVYSSYALIYIIRVLYGIDLIQVIISPIGS